MNDLRIPEQTYITLKLSDLVRFGYDILYVNHLFFFLSFVSLDYSTDTADCQQSLFK